ncbi:hypothetical protein AWC38_SpisGene3362 [Stylophora pistillata]|uniref:Uncharacterized protein n=1 Tax=Stylophora pistillata TaxID=50429 RepID=A0A2B4SRL1_STYPI|nr:hypothetical protein AWC38_SpisGene3362 [Stylophora pistillata]
MMVTLRRPRHNGTRQFMREVRHPEKSHGCMEFREITLKDPVVDPEWIFHHPRFRAETFTHGEKITPSDGLLSSKKVYRRVPSAGGEVRSRLLCERREGEGNETSRHFCELLGPNLCKECWKLVQRTEAFKEHRDRFPSELKRSERFKDPFSQVISSHDRKLEDNDSEEELFDETEDEEFISTSISAKKRSTITSPYDSGYSSRMSYIRSLSRTPSGEVCPRVTSRSRYARGGARVHEDKREISPKNGEVFTTPIWKNAYLAKLREIEPFREILTNTLHYPRKIYEWK